LKVLLLGIMGFVRKYEEILMIFRGDGEKIMGLAGDSYTGNIRSRRKVSQE